MLVQRLKAGLMIEQFQSTNSTIQQWFERLQVDLMVERFQSKNWIEMVTSLIDRFDTNFEILESNSISKIKK